MPARRQADLTHCMGKVGELSPLEGSGRNQRRHVRRIPTWEMARKYVPLGRIKEKGGGFLPAVRQEHLRPGQGIALETVLQGILPPGRDWGPSLQPASLPAQLIPKPPQEPFNAEIPGKMPGAGGRARDHEHTRLRRQNRRNTATRLAVPEGWNGTRPATSLEDLLHLGAKPVHVLPDEGVGA
jgi:hypothetical protein